jgi:two-component system cell cycle response regulator
MDKFVMYVDDDLDDQEVFVAVLAEFDSHLKCILAKNGLEALDLLASTPTPIHIFTDVNMPMMDGFELVRMLKSTDSFTKVPITVISTAQLGSRANELKAFDVFYALKPRSYQEYRQLLATSLGDIGKI